MPGKEGNLARGWLEVVAGASPTAWAEWTGNAMRLIALVGALALGIGSALGAASFDWEGAPGFFYSPSARWAFNPEQDLDFHANACPAIRRECPTLDSSDIKINAQFDELYDAHGRLSGLRMIKGSGCRPLDEAILLGQREFRTKFQKPGKSDLDDVELELAQGIDPAKVRILRRVTSFQFSSGC